MNILDFSITIKAEPNVLATIRDEILALPRLDIEYASLNLIHLIPTGSCWFKKSRDGQLNRITVYNVNRDLFTRENNQLYQVLFKYKDKYEIIESSQYICQTFELFDKNWIPDSPHKTIFTICDLVNYAQYIHRNKNKFLNASKQVLRGVNQLFQEKLLKLKNSAHGGIFNSAFYDALSFDCVTTQAFYDWYSDVFTPQVKRRVHVRELDYLNIPKISSKIQSIRIARILQVEGYNEFDSVVTALSKEHFEFYCEPSNNPCNIDCRLMDTPALINWLTDPNASYRIYELITSLKIMDIKASVPSPMNTLLETIKSYSQEHNLVYETQTRMLLTGLNGMGRPPHKTIKCIISFLKEELNRLSGQPYKTEYIKHILAVYEFAYYLISE